jgi:hypothetical protein
VCVSFDDHDEDEMVISMLQRQSDAVNGFNVLHSGALKELGVRPKIDGSSVPVWRYDGSDYCDHY